MPPLTQLLSLIDSGAPLDEGEDAGELPVADRRAQDLIGGVPLPAVA